MKNLQTLPIGKSSFERIRENNDLYVDKTKHIYQMASQGEYYFISRPRRFGKSLTVSTLRCLFQGRKELFEGLHISGTDWEWKKHPVILLDFNEISHDTTENLKLSLKETLFNIASQEGIELKNSLLKGQFKELICLLYKKTKMPVVILIDEYDKPLIDHLGKGKEHMDTARENRDVLKTFFGVMKGGDVSSVLRLVFITGVSRFSRVSIFSELNNLDDITMNRHYSEMLGYTQEELETCFSDHINRFAQEQTQSSEKIIEQLKNYYNGYRFSERDARVYNPFSVLKALNERAFKNFWFETGTPTFLVNLLHENNWYLPKIEDMRATEAVFSVYDIDRLQIQALLFQTGYVTIRDVKDRLYFFDYPNQEVKTAFLEILFHSYTQWAGNNSRFVLLAGYLDKEDINSFIETMTAIYASIPYTLETKRDEAYFHTIFYLMVCASGVNAHSEVLTSKGRIDLLVEFADKLYIIEFKCNQSADAGIKQIKDRGYDKKYMNTGKKIILMGINFDTEKRNISEWKCV
ncbi:AAA ATPase-like domain-containing protein, nuclease domain-containing [Desulfonema limicola]|uniref:AAA ATPase-like domain-containing protein, nuclease domain-containing n=1 Tax=Desulfonema limicola TaxID=45656 RepID=A0A975GGK1_9BACT|nr:ATP-binding protein [Desulfonema limicola]QTA80339.1 AAA ATPase-like domain-containing protein, nuclease domain-containing [Desulfonema limicola]